MLKQIRTKAPAARILLIGYPCRYSTGACGFGQPGLTKRTALHNGADALDKALSGAIANPGVTGSKRFVDVRAIFTGHDICASSSARWLNGLVLFNTAESFHPNSAGHAKGYLRALRNAVTAAASEPGPGRM